MPTGTQSTEKHGAISDSLPDWFMHQLTGRFNVLKSVIFGFIDFTRRESERERERVVCCEAFYVAWMHSNNGRLFISGICEL